MPQRSIYSRKIDIFVDDIKNIFSRLYEVTNTATVEDLAAILHTPVSIVNDAMRSKQLPLSWLMELHTTRGVSPLWILCGRGDVYCQNVYFDAEGLHSAWVDC